jgi:hypothetical protein
MTGMNVFYKVLWFGREGQYNALVMELLAPSLHNHVVSFPLWVDREKPSSAVGLGMKSVITSPRVWACVRSVCMSSQCAKVSRKVVLLMSRVCAKENMHGRKKGQRKLHCLYCLVGMYGCLIQSIFSGNRSISRGGRS